MNSEFWDFLTGRGGRQKHLPGKHDQKTHGRRLGSGVRNTSGEFVRYTRRDTSPMSDYGHAMFAQLSGAAERREGLSRTYGDIAWSFDPSQKGVARIADLESVMRSEWKKTMRQVENYEYYSEGGENLEQFIGQDFDEIFSSFSPKSIITSAGAYDDPDLTAWLWFKVLEPRGLGAVVTPDGAIVYDETLIQRRPESDYGQ